MQHRTLGNTGLELPVLPCCRQDQFPFGIQGPQLRQVMIAKAGGQGFKAEEIFFAAAHPAVVVSGQHAGRDQAMQVKMIDQKKIGTLPNIYIASYRIMH